jgi:hypothetical protein
MPPAGLSSEFLALTSPTDQAAATRVRLMPDTDGDGIADFRDNAIFVANPNQRDTDGDGYGNVVDADFNNDRSVDFFDLSIFSSRFFTPNPDADLNGDGTVDFFDLSMFQSLFGRAPGPSFIDLPPPSFGDGPQPTGALLPGLVGLPTQEETAPGIDLGS